MMREMSTPVCVESKYDTGSRTTCASTLRRMSVIACCAATPSTWERAKEVAASISVAAPAARASRGSRSWRCLMITSSIRNFEHAGRTSPATRLMSMRSRPRARRERCSEISRRASPHASDHRIFLLSAKTTPPSPSSLRFHPTRARRTRETRIILPHPVAGPRATGR